MYGGLQMAIGTPRSIGATRDEAPGLGTRLLRPRAQWPLHVPSGRHGRRGRASYLSFSTKIAPGKYNQVGLAMYELPNMILGLAPVPAAPTKSRLEHRNPWRRICLVLARG